MLIPHRLLDAALTHMSARNHLIKQLNNSPTTHTNSLYHFILSFWLGSHTTRYHFDFKYLSIEVMRCIYKSFFLLLILEKELGSYPINSSEFRLIKSIRDKIFRWYNKNYLSVTENPQRLINYFSDLVSAIPRKFFSVFTNLGVTKWLCESEIKNPFALQDKRAPFPTTLMILHNGWRNIFARIALSTITLRPLMLYPFFYNAINDNLTNSLSRQKIFLRSAEGLILDGTYIYDRFKPSKTVILALIGALQSEHRALDCNWVPYRNLFASDIVFINHRNYATRSHVLANKFEELQSDVIAFVKYFKRRKKDIVLYGMCAGAAPMILAANSLTAERVPYKLIIDRFFSSYGNFADFKQIKRTIQYQGLTEATYWQIASQLWHVLCMTVMLKTIYPFSEVKINFAERIRQIPANNVLILQAKAKKHPVYSEPEFTDLFIHPKNDIRIATKQRRRADKAILQCLSEQCWQLTHLYVESATSRRIFLRLSCFFDKYLKLIDNEKLTLTPATTYFGKPTDIHSHRLFDLRARHDLPLAQFLPGFFNKPKRPCDAAISDLRMYNSSTILAALHALHPLSSHSAITKIAGTLQQFFASLHEHKDFIIHVGNRLAATKLGNLDVLIKQMLRIPLFRLLENDKTLVSTPSIR